MEILSGNVGIDRETGEPVVGRETARYGSAVHQQFPHLGRLSSTPSRAGEPVGGLHEIAPANAPARDAMSDQSPALHVGATADLTK